MAPEPRPAGSDHAPNPAGSSMPEFTPTPPLLGTASETPSTAGYLPRPKLFSLPLELFLAIAELLPVGALFRLNSSSRQLYPVLQHLLDATFLEHSEHILSWAIGHNDPHLLTRVLPNRSYLEEHEVLRIIQLDHAALIPPVLDLFPEHIIPDPPALDVFPEHIIPDKDGARFSPLIAAVYRRSLGCIVALLDAGHCPDQITGYGRLLLSEAIHLKDVPTVELLLRRGANPNGQDIYRETPLHHAMFSCSLIFVDILLRAGALTDMISDIGLTPMLVAIGAGACSGCFETRRALIAAGATRVSCSVVEEGEDWRGDTMLWAVKFSEQLVVVCVEAGWVGHCVEGWATPLQIAVRHGKMQAAITLLEAGEDVNELGDGLDSGTNGWAPLHESTSHHSSPHMIDLLVESGARLDILGGVSMNGKDCDVPGGGKGLTPLQLAKERGNLAAVEMLEACGARI